MFVQIVERLCSIDLRERDFEVVLSDVRQPRVFEDEVGVYLHLPEEWDEWEEVFAMLAEAIRGAQNLTTEALSVV